MSRRSALTQLTPEAAARVAEEYYDSDDADRFYFEVWGGEDIHVGLYESEDEPIPDASRRTVETITAMLGDLPAGSRVIDLGAGYGGAARYLAREKGWRVDCVNISETQNALNRRLTAEAGLDDKVSVLHGSFDDVPAESGAYDAVWSQDSFLHGGDRQAAIDEAARLLKPGGQLIFTDPMKADDAPDEALNAILKRIRLSSLASVAFYREAAKTAGLQEIEVIERPEQLRRHYNRVREELTARRGEVSADISSEYIDNMITGLGHWVDGADAGRLNWGILHFRKA